MTNRQQADAAVRRGIAWLDKSVRDWRRKIEPEFLNLAYCDQCILGQLDGDFYHALWDRHLTRAQVYRYGFSAPKGMRFSTLTAAWRRALSAGDGSGPERNAP